MGPDLEGRDVTGSLPPTPRYPPLLFTTEFIEISVIINSNAETFSALLVRERCWFIHAKYEKYERDHVRSVSFRVHLLGNDTGHGRLRDRASLWEGRTQEI